MWFYIYCVCTGVGVWFSVSLIVFFFCVCVCVCLVEFLCKGLCGFIFTDSSFSFFFVYVYTFFNLLLVLQYLAVFFFFLRFSWLGCRISFFLSFELSSLLTVVFFFDRGSRVFFVVFLFLEWRGFDCSSYALSLSLSLSLSHLKKQSPKMDFHNSESLLIV